MLDFIKIDDTTFKTTQDGIVVGGTGQQDFDPSIVFKRWGTHELKYKLDTSNTYKPPEEDTDQKLKVVSDDNKEELHFYELGDNKFEFEIIVEGKPSKNCWTFKIEGAEDYDFLYQPFFTYPHEFTKDGKPWLREFYETDAKTPKADGKIEEGNFAEMPVNVAGSYAVYHKSLRNGVYKTGKYQHIYRPEVIDKKGNKTWGILHIENGEAKITVDQDWLDNAEYPIKIDPSFGQTAEGGTSFNYSDDYIRCQNIGNAPAAGTVTDIWIYGGGFISTPELGLALYDQSGGYAHDPKDATTEIAVTTTLQWWTAGTTEGNSLVNGAPYNLAWWLDDGSMNIYYDTDADYDYDWQAATYPAGTYDFSDWISDLTGHFNANRRHSIYLDYTVGGTPSASPSASPSPSVSPSGSPSVTPSVSPSVTPSVSPSESPSVSPSASPSESPSVSPSESPSGSPSVSPSESPSISPSVSPSESPSVSPSTSPSESPSVSPSASPSPSATPSVSPSESPSVSPSASPSESPSVSPSGTPSVSPSGSPSGTPSVSPSGSPSGGMIDENTYHIYQNHRLEAYDDNALLFSSQNDVGNIVHQDLLFAPGARIRWAKHTATAATLVAGTGTSTASDLQTAFDGNTYDIAEAAATPGIDMIVDFELVQSFNWIHIIAYYAGSSSHTISIEVYNWDTTAWDRYHSMEDSGGDTMTDYSLIVPDDTNYIGTGGDAGNVRVRFNHTQAGNNLHDLYIDVVALYR